MSVKIVLADDHPIMRQGLRSLLEKQANFDVIGEAEDGLKTLQLVEQLEPDILVVDVMMPRLNGLEVTRRVQRSSPKTKVVVLSMHSNEPYILEALQSGASAYVLKSSTANSLVEAVEMALRGRRFLSPPLNEVAIEAFIQNTTRKLEKEDGLSLLTNREREVFNLAIAGLSNQEIAERLIISPRTVETHRTNFMRKLRLRNEADLVRYAVQQGFIDSSL